MRRMHVLLAGLLLAASPAAAQAPDVAVTFVAPERYTDATFDGAYGEKGRAPALREIREHLERLGARHLKPGERLRIAVLDVDLAGQYEPWRPSAYHVRFLRAVTPPRITLRYTLEGQAGALASGQEVVSDLDYQRPLVRDTGRLPYEKAMLEDWFRRRFVERKPQG
jgi:hypothetical protein